MSIMQSNRLCATSHIIDRGTTIISRYTLLLGSRPMHLLLIRRHRVTWRWRDMVRIRPTARRHNACPHVARGWHPHLLHPRRGSWRSLVVRNRTWWAVMARWPWYNSRRLVTHVHLLLSWHRLPYRLVGAWLSFRVLVIAPHLLLCPTIRLTCNSFVLASRIARCTCWGCLEAISGAHSRWLAKDRGLCWWCPWVSVITTSIIVHLQHQQGV